MISFNKSRAKIPKQSIRTIGQNLKILKIELNKKKDKNWKMLSVKRLTFSSFCKFFFLTALSCWRWESRIRFTAFQEHLKRRLSKTRKLLNGGRKHCSRFFFLNSIHLNANDKNRIVWAPSKPEDALNLAENDKQWTQLFKHIWLQEW